MNLFDQLVDEALTNNIELSSLRVVVEKELLHHDILRTLKEAGLLEQLTFIGGTCLRTCYGSNRLSEDLDFTGGSHFDRETLLNMTHVLTESLENKYSLQVKIKEPTREIGNVDTWTLKIQTRPERKHFPAQRINIDICAIPSYQACSAVLLNPYGVDMGTSGLIVRAESREEIFADKLIAFALRPNRVKYRDLWDICWLHQEGVKLPIELIPHKIQDHHRQAQDFLKLLNERNKFLNTSPKIGQEFIQEMARFLPFEAYKKISEQADFWDYVTNTVDFYCGKIQALVKAP